MYLWIPMVKLGCFLQKGDWIMMILSLSLSLNLVEINLTQVSVDEKDKFLGPIWAKKLDTPNEE